jgi:nitroimidazol reductase NimA-like FMN-containing flavoprotein (pyridoxamine 5'-phosphate oxidase superfamily)
MRRKDKEITDHKLIVVILSESMICRIAMIDNDVPYIMPLNYGYFNNALYIHSASKGKKIEILKKNNRVCFEIENYVEIIKHDEPCHWSTKYRSLIGYGTVEIINDFDRKKEGLDIIMAQHGKTGTNFYNENNINAIVILKLNIESISGKQSGNWD